MQHLKTATAVLISSALLTFSAQADESINQQKMTNEKPSFEVIDSKYQHPYEHMIKDLYQRSDKAAAQTQFRTGLNFEQGINVPVNHLEAVAWYARAAENGHAHAGYRLALLLNMQGHHDESYQWLEWSADKSEPNALFRLGKIHGTDEASDEVLYRAIGFYDRSAQLGHPYAQSEADRLRQELRLRKHSQAVSEFFKPFIPADY